MSLLARVISISVAFIALFFSASLCFASDTVVTVRVGDIEVSMLSERQRDSDTSILFGASAADIKKFIPTGKYLSAVNVFLIRSLEAVYLVDTGFGEKLFENMAGLGINAEDVDYLLITHSHGDHIGGMVKDGKPTLPRAKVYVSEKEADWSEALREKLKLYENRVVRFTPAQLEDSGTELFRGISAIAAYGHTPGHTVFQVESGGEKLLIWGDLTHAMAIQMPRPEVSVSYDDDPGAAADIRKAILKYVSANKIRVAGMHIAYPGIGMAGRDESGAGEYKFVY